MSFTKEQVERAVKSKGYQWFDDLNIVGIRNNNPSIAKKVTNVFDDWITITYSSIR